MADIISQSELLKAFIAYRWHGLFCNVVLSDCDLTLLSFSLIRLFPFKTYFLQISEKWRLCWDLRGGWMILKANWNWWVLKSETEICVKIGVIFESERLSDQIEVRYLTPDRRIDAALDQTGYLVHDKIWASLLDDKLALQHLIESSLSETKLYPGSDKNTFSICHFWRKKLQKFAGAQKPGGGKSGSTAMGGGGGSSHWKGKVSSFKIFHQHVPRKWMNIFEQIKRRGEADDFMGGLHILWQPWKLPNKTSHFFFFWRVCQFSMIGRRREGPRPWSRPCSNSLGRWTITSEPNNYEGITPCTILHNVQCAMHLA